MPDKYEKDGIIQIHHENNNSISEISSQQNIREELMETDEWSVAKVTINGKDYVIMPILRRQKIIDFKDVESENLKNVMLEIEAQAYLKAESFGLEKDDLQTAVLQLQRLDTSDFFDKHLDANKETKRCFSFFCVIASDDAAGGKVEFFTKLSDDQEKDSIVIDLSDGDSVSYRPDIPVSQTKVLRGTQFCGLCILEKRSES